MSTYNSCTFVGNLVADPDDLKDGEVSKFRMAIDYGFGDRKGTLFQDVLCLKNTSKFVLKFLRKGSKVLVEGELQDNSYEKEGTRIFQSQIKANVVRGFKAASEAGGSEQGSSDTGNSSPSEGSDDNDDCPF